MLLSQASHSNLDAESTYNQHGWHACVSSLSWVDSPVGFLLISLFAYPIHIDGKRNGIDGGGDEQKRIRMDREWLNQVSH